MSGVQSVEGRIGTTPCYGKSALFDSTDLYDHEAAKELCMACPTLTACMAHLLEVKRTSGPFGQPEGTWAGELLEDKRPAERRSRRRMFLDDQMYDDQDAKTAHAQYVAGMRNDWTETGERVYQARNNPTPRAAKKVA